MISSSRGRGRSTRMPARRASVATAAGVRGLRAGPGQHPGERPLVGLVEVAHDGAAPVGALGEDRRGHRARDAGPWRRRTPSAGPPPAHRPAIAASTGSSTGFQNAASVPPARAASSRPRAGRRAPGRRRAAARTAPIRRRAGRRARAAAAPRERPDVERVVEHPGVAQQRGRRRCGPQRGVAGDLAVLPLGDAQRGAAGDDVAGQRDELVDQLLARGLRARDGASASSRSGGPSPPSSLVSDGGSSTSTPMTVLTARTACRRSPSRSRRVATVVSRVSVDGYVSAVLRLVARRHVDLMRVASAICRLPR